jgi:hypothetical protein
VNLRVSTRIPGGAASVHEGRHCLLRCEFAVLRPALLSCRRCETGGMGGNSESLVPERVVTKRLRHVRPHGGRTRAAVLVPIRPEEKAVGAAWDLTESVGLMREASRRGFARDRVLERSARRVSTRRSVALCGERRGVGWASPLDTIQVGMRGNAAGPV